MARASLNNKGMTLIEILIAFTILAIVSTALLQSSIIGMRLNLTNALRDEAVNMADQRMNELRNTAFSAILSNLTETPVQSKSRAAYVVFTPVRTVTPLNATTLQVTLAVNWSYMGQPNVHSVTSIVRQQ